MRGSTDPRKIFKAATQLLYLTSTLLGVRADPAYEKT